MKQKYFYLLAVIGFVVAASISYRASERAAGFHVSGSSSQALNRAREFFPQAQFIASADSPDQWMLCLDEDRKPAGKILLTKPFVNEQGYSGAVHLLIAADLKEKILGVQLIEHTETEDVIRFLDEKEFFRAWNGISVQEALRKDVDAVSGATLTTQAITRAFKKRLALLTPAAPAVSAPPISFRVLGANLLALAALAFSLFVFFHRRESRLWRNLSLVVNVVILGFVTAKMLSFALFYGWIRSGISFADAVFVIWVAAIASIFIYNKNIYCQCLCPFGAAQQLLGQLTRQKFSLRLLPVFQWIGFVYFSMILGFLLAAAPLRLESTEPFAAFLWYNFLSPAGIMFGLWLFVSIFCGRFWCNFLCPTGRALNGFLVKTGQNRVLSVIVFVVCVASAVTLTRWPRAVIVAPQEAAAPTQQAEIPFHVAAFFRSLADNIVQCTLCPRQCTLKPNETGFCRARKNIQGKLYALTYGQPVAVHVDPVEKKPFSHVYPGTKSFSIATAGCNLRCKFCQNWEISQLDAEQVKAEFVAPEQIVAKAKETGSKTIAFTYTEPVIFYEYMMDIAKAAKEQGVACVMHSAGFVNEEPLRALAQYLTAANIDLKGFDEKFYTTFTSGDLNVVLRTLKVLKEEGVWVEITTLLIPSANDSDQEIRKLCAWVRDHLGPETPIHFSRFYPMYKLTNLSPTPVATLLRAQDIAKSEGLQFVYIGNVPSQTGENTACPHCGKLLIKRKGYHVLEDHLLEGKCPDCGHEIPGVWR